MSTFVIMPSDSFKAILLPIIVSLELIGFDGLESKQEMLMKVPLIWKLTMKSYSEFLIHLAH